MSILSSVLDIANKLFPNRKRRDFYLEGALIQDLEKALQEGRDTDAARIRKQLKMLREGMDYSDGD